MGSDMKSKEKKHRKRTISSSDSEDEGRRRRKRHRSVEEEKDEETKKSNKKSSHKHSKRHSHKEKKDKKSRDKDKGKHQKDYPESTYEIIEISKDDYFSKNSEFSTWLKEEKKVFFSDLSTDSARDMFTHFVKAWNARKLETKYYEGTIVSAPRSAHKWKIKA